MSTIAYDGKSVAFETQVGFGNNIDPYEWEKVKPITGNVTYAYAGGAGETDIVDEFIDWIQNACGGNADFPKLCVDRSGESTFIAFTHDGEWHEFERRGTPVLKTRKPNAIGSGRQYALGAMHAGANAVDAVHVAAKLDPYSNDDVRSYELIDMRGIRHANESKT